MSDDTPRPASGYTNTWLADMGYGTWRKVMARMHMKMEALPERLHNTSPENQEAWRAAAAAIRRRVVNWRLPAEETDGATQDREAQDRASEP